MTHRSEDNTAQRRALRREMTARRAALDAGQHAGLSAAIVGRLLAVLPQPRCVAFCWPVKHEPDVVAAVETWISRGAQAALPVVVEESAPLAFRAWTREAPLHPDRYGIPTPTTGDWLHPDLLLLPLNGFDAAGFRLGYGGGYFDRTLAVLSPRPLVVGVGFEINRLPSIEPQAHDQRLDWIVTEAGAFRISAA